MQSWKSGGTADGTHIVPGSAQSSPEVTIPRQASTSVIHVGVLGVFVVGEAAHTSSATTKGPTARDETLSPWVHCGAGPIQS